VICSAGWRIFSEGDPGDRLYVVVEGAVSIRKGGRVLRTLRDRDSFGEMSILDGEPRSAAAVADADSVLLEIRQEQFHDILARHFEVAVAVIRTLSRRIRTMEKEAGSREAEGEGQAS
jgi:CRP-like cAMP-binding protein